MRVEHPHKFIGMAFEIGFTLILITGTRFLLSFVFLDKLILEVGDGSCVLGAIGKRDNSSNPNKSASFEVAFDLAFDVFLELVFSNFKPKNLGFRFKILKSFVFQHNYPKVVK